MRKLIVAMMAVSCSYAMTIAQTIKRGDKLLVTYFSVPETVGVDASTGASPFVIDGKTQVTPAHVAPLIG